MFRIITVSDIARSYNARKHSRERYRPMHIDTSQYESFKWLSTIDDHENEDINVFYLYDDHRPRSEKNHAVWILLLQCYRLPLLLLYYSTNISAILGVCRRDSLVRQHYNYLDYIIIVLYYSCDAHIFRIDTTGN